VSNPLVQAVTNAAVNLSSAIDAYDAANPQPPFTAEGCRELERVITKLQGLFRDKCPIVQPPNNGS
jgi:hypothetical protein